MVSDNELNAATTRAEVKVKGKVVPVLYPSTTP
jgi:hypothetical protein